MKRFLFFVIVCGLCIIALTSFALEKERVIVLTDISNEPDDEESLVRFLVYANEYEVEGLIATTSVWLRNEPRLDLIQRQVKAYGQIRDNLSRHASGFPTMERLLSVSKTGQPAFGMDAVGEGKSTAGSNHIIHVVDQSDARPVWISVWGGANTLAQALWDVRNTRSDSETLAFVAKLRVYTISDQDDAGQWLRVNFPTLFYIVSPSTVDWREYYKATWTGIGGDRHYKNGPMHYFEMVDNPWLRKHIIHNHGPLGALYPEVEYIMEGDTPSFLNLINNGLGSFLDPAYGGWGGRYELYQSYGETRPIYTNSRDTVTAQDGSIHTTAQASIWRWRDAYQFDFAARMDWCVAEEYSQANHNPVVILNGREGKDVVSLNVRSGEKVSLSAAGSNDPDGDELEITWFVYPEAGSYPGRIELSPTSYSAFRTEFTAPEVKQKETVHVIVQVKDLGEPPLFAYRRAIVTVEPAS
jgi:hypothetical protein